VTSTRAVPESGAVLSALASATSDVVVVLDRERDHDGRALPQGNVRRAKASTELRSAI